MSPHSLSKRILHMLFLVYFFTAIVVPNQIKIFNKASISDLILLLVLIYYFIIILLSKDFSFKYLFDKIYAFIKYPLILCMIVLFLVMLASTVYSANKAISVTESLRFLLYILAGFIVISELKNVRYFNSFIITYAAAAITVNFIGFYQFITKKGITVNLNINGSTARIQSTFGNPNAFGAFLVISLFPFILFLLFYKDKKYKLFYLFVSLLCFVNLLMSFSRNSWLSFAIGVVILIFTYNWRFIFLAIAGGSAMLLIPAVNTRIREFTDVAQNEGRIKIWSIALKMIKEHPYGGVGNGNFSELYDSYVKKYPQYWQENVSQFPTHNSYLKIESELGAPGGLSFLLTLFFIFRSLLTAYKNYTGEVRYFYHGFLISSICFLILNIFDNILFIPQTAIVFWIFVFLSAGITDKDN